MLGFTSYTACAIGSYGQAPVPKGTHHSLPPMMSEGVTMTTFDINVVFILNAILDLHQAFLSKMAMKLRDFKISAISRKF